MGFSAVYNTDVGIKQKDKSGFAGDQDSGYSKWTGRVLPRM